MSYKKKKGNLESRRSLLVSTASNDMERAFKLQEKDYTVALNQAEDNCIQAGKINATVSDGTQNQRIL